MVTRLIATSPDDTQKPKPSCGLYPRTPRRPEIPSKVDARQELPDVLRWVGVKREVQIRDL